MVEKFALIMCSSCFECVSIFVLFMVSVWFMFSHLLLFYINTQTNTQCAQNLAPTKLGTGNKCVMGVVWAGPESDLLALMCVKGFVWAGPGPPV